MRITTYADAAAVGEPQGEREEVCQAVEDRITRSSLFLWEDGRPVSMAAGSRQTTHGIVVNQVYTPPELRNRGYATSCVAALSQHLLDQGHTFCALFADLGNPTSNSIYQRIGYRPVVDFGEYYFGVPDGQKTT